MLLHNEPQWLYAGSTLACCWTRFAGVGMSTLSGRHTSAGISEGWPTTQKWELSCFSSSIQSCNVCQEWADVTCNFLEEADVHPVATSSLIKCKSCIRSALLAARDEKSYFLPHQVQGHGLPRVFHSLPDSACQQSDSSICNHMFQEAMQ